MSLEKTLLAQNGTHKGEFDVIVVGAGLSGLACSVILSQHGYSVCLLESARQIGGRARTVQFKNFLNNQPIDNGQHIMLGAYHSTIQLLTIMGVQENNYLERHNLELNLYFQNGHSVHLNSPTVPAPLHLLIAFMKMKGMSYIERYKILKMALKLAITNYKLKNDISVKELLIQHSQTETIINILWEPLCLAIMNTPIEYASAQVFLNVLKDSFDHKRQDSDLLFFKQDLSPIFCQPAINYITQNGGKISCQQKVVNFSIKSLVIEQTKKRFTIQTQTHKYYCQDLVIATPAHISNKLLQTVTPDNILLPPDSSLHYQYEPICTVYLQYPESIQLPYRMIGLIHTTAQWAIDRSVTNQQGLIAVVISGPGIHTQMTHEQLVNTVHAELSHCIVDLPDVINHQVIIEKKATFSCRVNIEQQRPDNATKIEGLYLAGDYTNTNYPSTIEGAIRSGQTAAFKIIEKSTHSQ